MIVARYIPYRLIFNFEAGTSRGVLTYKDSWFIITWNDDNPEHFGIGECSLIQGLSPDPLTDYEKVLKDVCTQINHIDSHLQKKLVNYPSIRFGLETALRDLETEGKRVLFSSDFTRGADTIKINGLIWMGNRQEMLKRIEEKIDTGFKCLKLKIGAIDFEEELSLLKLIRSRFSADILELRLDANGAFKPAEALRKLERLSKHHIHSVEQPIKAKQWENMARLCEVTPIPIALDEELIGIEHVTALDEIIRLIKPHYIILKPSLIGGLNVAEQFIASAEKLNTGWWVTSALESNIGLNAIAQWTYLQHSNRPQGLGTGQLFNNNFSSPLGINSGKLYYDPSKSWNTDAITHSI